MNNNNLSNNISQINNVNNSNEDFDRIEYIQNLRGYGQQVFDILVIFIKKFGKTYISQRKIAIYVGCNLRTVNRWIKEFKIRSLITKFNRIWRTCVYRLHPFLEFFCNGIINGMENCRTLYNKRIYILKTVNSNSNFKRNNSNNILRSKNIEENSQFNFNCFNLILKKTRGKDMSSNETLLIPAYIKNIQHLDLTIAGMVYLSGFPEEVIQGADIVLGRMKNPPTTNLYRYFCGICKNIANEREEIFDREIFSWLKDQYKCKQDDNRLNRDMVINSAPIKKPLKGVPSTAKRQVDTRPRRVALNRDGTINPLIDPETIHHRPYRYGGNKISFPRDWTPDMRIEFMNEKWPIGTKCPIINDPRNKPSFKEPINHNLTRCVYAEYRTYDSIFGSSGGTQKLKAIGFKHNFNPFGANLLKAIKQNKFTHERILEIKDFLESKLDIIPDDPFFNSFPSDNESEIAKQMQEKAGGVTPKYIQLLNGILERIKLNNIETTLQSYLFEAPSE